MDVKVDRHIRKVKMAYDGIPQFKVEKVEVYPRGGTGDVLLQIYFTYEDEKMREDYAFHIDDPLPKVKDLRERNWNSTHAYLTAKRNGSLNYYLYGTAYQNGGMSPKVSLKKNKWIA